MKRREQRSERNSQQANKPAISRTNAVVVERASERAAAERASARARRIWGELWPKIQSAGKDEATNRGVGA